MNQEIELTLEQDFSLRNFSDLVQQMSHKQAQAFLIEQHKLMMIRDSLYQDFLRQEWRTKLDSALL